jgi:hypothetical protein
MLHPIGTSLIARRSADNSADGTCRFLGYGQCTMLFDVDISLLTRLLTFSENDVALLMYGVTGIVADSRSIGCCLRKVMMNRSFVDDVTRVRSELDDFGLFDVTLALTVGVTMVELAVELLGVDTQILAGALIAGASVWTISAVFSGAFLQGSPQQPYVLCMAGLTASLLMLPSGTETSVPGLGLYVIDCLGKFAVALVALQIQNKRDMRTVLEATTHVHLHLRHVDRPYQADMPSKVHYSD